MQLQQLRYLIAVAEEGSFRAASMKLYVSQSSVSVAIKDFERETGITIFERTTRGTTLTAAGIALVNYARNIIEQVDLMEQRYARDSRVPRTRFAVSSQHYSLVVDAFADFAVAHDDPVCDFTLRESRTADIMRDVQELRSELGVMYLSSYNDRVVRRALADAVLVFTPLYTAVPHVVLSRKHELANHEILTLNDLAPYYQITQEQGPEGSAFFAEEPLAAIPHDRKIIVEDNGTLCSLLARCDGYAIGTGAFRSEGDVVSVPLETDEIMNVGYIRREDIIPNALAREFLQLLAKRILAFEEPIEPTDIARELAG